MPEITPAGTRRLEIDLDRSRPGSGMTPANGGSDVASLLEQLRKRPGIHQATIFGQSIHALVDAERSLGELGLEELKVRPAEPSLEDVFVTLARAQSAPEQSCL
jgi:ABC-2 type transport system ATP-binding protein